MGEPEAGGRRRMAGDFYGKLLWLNQTLFLLQMH